MAITQNLRVAQWIPTAAVANGQAVVVTDATPVPPDTGFGAPVTALANPSVLVGLSAKNGSGFAAMRADAAPALDQAIAPTWTGKHIFALTGSAATWPVSIESSQPGLMLKETDGTVDNQLWRMYVAGEVLNLGVANDAVSTAGAGIQMTRVGGQVANVKLCRGSSTEVLRIGEGVASSRVTFLGSG